MCIGDLNDLTSSQDKRGGRSFRALSARGLSSFVDLQGAVDLGFSRNRFTWNNDRPRAAHTKERLDKGVSSLDWRLAFPNATITHCPISKSDHKPIVLHLWGLLHLSLDNSNLSNFGFGITPFIR